VSRRVGEAGKQSKGLIAYRKSHIAYRLSVIAKQFAIRD